MVLDDWIRLAALVIYILFYSITAYRYPKEFNFDFESFVFMIIGFWPFWVMSELCISAFIKIGLCEGCVSWFK